MPAATIGEFGLGDFAITGAVLQDFGFRFSALVEKLADENGGIIDREDYDEEATFQTRAVIKQSTPWAPELCAAFALTAGTLPDYHSNGVTAGTPYLNDISGSRPNRGFRTLDVSADSNPGL